MGAMIDKKDKLLTPFDSYVIDKQIGQGGNGTVYSAKNRNGESVAVKAIDISKLSDEKIKRLKNEISFCMNNECSNIIKIFDYGVYKENIIFYTMQLGKETLRNRMQHGLSGEDAYEIFIELLKGIKYAHEKNVYHRDIKPENILFFDDGNRAVIADFGIAHFSVEEMYTLVETKKSSRMANFQYAAPEQREKGMTVDGRADLFALGLILNEMFTGHIVAGINYIKIRDVNEKFEFLDKIFEKLYCQNPDDRFESATDIIEQIRILAEIAKKENEIVQIKDVEKENYNVVSPKILSSKVRGTQIIFELSDSMPYGWHTCLKEGRYAHSYVVGYDTDKFFGNGDQITIEVGYGINGNILKDIVKYLKLWIIKTTSIYNENECQKHDREIRQKKEQKYKELELLEREKNLNQILSELIHT